MDLVVIPCQSVNGRKRRRRESESDMAKRKSLLINIYENDAEDPILGHVFYGDINTINAVIAAHQRTDEFFDAAMTSGKWKGMTLRTTQHWL